MSRTVRFALIAMSLSTALAAGCSSSKKEPVVDPANHSASVVSQESQSSCMVASVQPLATDAGLAAFKSGGNAVDAAIATALTLGVVDGYNSGIGGGCFILIRKPDGSLLAIDGRETAPAAAERDMYLRDGKAVAELSQTGALAVATPGAIAAYAKALEDCGQLKLADLLEPAAKIAEEGFPMSGVYHRRLKGEVEELAKFAGSRQIFLKPDRTAWPEGHVLRQADLAKTYRAIAAEGPDWFYRGPFAEKVGQWMKDNGGVLAAEDFARYAPVVREPLQTTYRDYTIVGFPPPSSGGVHVAEMLNILENFDLRAEQERDPVRAEHLIAEAMKLAFADRAYWLGDPGFADVPRGLLDKAYAKELFQRIDPDRTVEVPDHGQPPRAAEDLFGKKHTTHIAAVDDEGYWVAITATVNTTFGSKVVVPGTGVALNNQMDDFSAQPGAPNAFELVGAEANAVAPGKRPLSSMTPTIVLKDGQPVLTVGAAGGPKIITQVLLTIVRRLDFQQPLTQAVADPRIHHQWKPDELWVEEFMPAETMAGLEKYGHKLRKIASGGVTQAIEVDAAGQLVGVHDPRVPGKAAAATR
jgi:gamma-glutamyltranspeptidase/glutathione hydrolase